MSLLSRIRYNIFSQDSKVDELVTELIRKSIHILSALTVVFASLSYRWYWITIAGITGISILYIISELLRMHNYELCCIARITRHAARKRDKGRIVLGPLTLAAGVLFALLMFPLHTAKIAIFALAFGDGLASLVGKKFGKQHLRIAKDKTVAGSLACFTAVFCSSLAVTFDFEKSLILGITAMVIEMLPIKDFDNVLIPIVIGSVALLIHA